MRPIPEQASLKCTLPAFHPNLQPEQNNLPDVSALQHRQMLANSLSLTNLSSAAHQQHRPQQQHASFGFQPPNQLEQRHQQDEYGVVDDLALANLQQVRSLIDPPTQPDIIHSLENTIGNTAAANGAITYGRIANIAGLPAASSSVSSPRHPPTAPPQHLKTSAGQAFPHLHQPQPASRLKPDAIHFSQSQNHFRNQYNRYHGPATEQQPSDRIQYQSMYQIPRSSSHSHIGNQPASNPTMQTKSFAPTHRLPSRAHPPPAYSSQLPPSKRYKGNDVPQHHSQPFTSSPVNPTSSQAIQQRLLQNMQTMQMQNVQNMQNMQSHHPPLQHRNHRTAPHPTNPQTHAQRQVHRNLHHPPQYKAHFSHSVSQPTAKHVATVLTSRQPAIPPLAFNFQPQSNQENNPRLAYALSPNYSDTSSSIDTSKKPGLNGVHPAAGGPPSLFAPPSSSAGPSADVGGEKHVCPHGCGRAYARAHSLSVHIATKHGSALGGPAAPHAEYGCGSCGKVFNRKDTLKRHVATMHERQRRWACDVCGRRFGQQAHLNTHVRCVHRKDRPYACEMCPKAFGTLYNLNAHRNTHRKTQKAFACGVCRKTYKIKSSLARHRRKAAHPAAPGEDDEPNTPPTPVEAGSGAGSAALAHMGPVHAGTVAQSLLARDRLR